MKEDEGWLDRSRNVTRLVQALYVVCAALLLADLFYHKHSYFAFEHWFGFYAGFGFIAYVAIVMAAKLLRRVLRRSEDYYERRRGDA